MHMYTLGSQLESIIIFQDSCFTCIASWQASDYDLKSIKVNQRGLRAYKEHTDKLCILSSRSRNMNVSVCQIDLSLFITGSSNRSL